MLKQSSSVLVVLLVGAVSVACGGGQPARGGAGGSVATDPIPGDVSAPAPDLSMEVVPPIPDAAAQPPVPDRIDGERDGEQDLGWGHQPGGTIILDGDRTSVQAFARSLRSVGKLSYTPVLPGGIDVGPSVYASPNSASDVYDQLIIVYPSPRYGWFGIWERAAIAGEADTYLDSRLSMCDPPAHCVPASPERILLDNGTPAVLSDPGGITWAQDGMIFELAGPWANFGASRSIPLANAISAAATVLTTTG